MLDRAPVDAAAQPVGPTDERGSVARVRELGVRLRELRALFDIERDVDVRVELLGEVATPGRDFVGPGDDPEPVLAERFDRERADPMVVAGEAHRRALPGPSGLVAELELRRDLGVTVREDVGGDRHGVAHGALHRETARVHVGADVLDGHRFGPVGIDDGALQPQLLVARGLARVPRAITFESRHAPVNLDAVGRTSRSYLRPAP